MSPVKLSAVEEIQFGAWRLSPKSQKITDGEVSKELEPLIYTLLVYLLENHERIIPKSELVDYVWRQKYVDDNAINRAFSVLRKILKSENQRGLIVKTHYRKGYSIIVPVEFILVSDIQQEPLTEEPVPEALSTPNPIKGKDNDRTKKKAFSLFIFFTVLLAGLITIFFTLIEPLSGKEELEKKIKGEVLTWRGGSVGVPRLSQGEALLAYTHMPTGNNDGALIVKSLSSGKEWEVYTPLIADEQAFPVAWYQDSIVYFQVLNYRTEEKCEIWQADISLLVNGASDSAQPQKIFDCKSTYVMQGDIVTQGQFLIYIKHSYRHFRRASSLVSRNLLTGEEYQISTPPTDFMGDYYVKANSKKNRIAYLRSKGVATKVMVSKLDGSGLKELTTVNYFISAFTWNKDDTELTWLKEGVNPSLVTLNINSLALTERDINLNNAHPRTLLIYRVDLFKDSRVVLASQDAEKTIKRYRFNASEFMLLPFIDLPGEELVVEPLTNKEEYIFLSRNTEHLLWRYNNGAVKKIGRLENNWAKNFALSPNKQQIAVYERDVKMHYQINIYSLEPFEKIHELKLPGKVYSVNWLNEKELLLTYLNTESKVVLARYNILKKMLIIETSDCLCSRGASLDNGVLYTLSDQNKLYRYDFEQKSHQILKQFTPGELYEFIVHNDSLYIVTTNSIELHSLSSEFESIVFPRGNKNLWLSVQALYRGANEDEIFVRANRYNNNHLYLFDLSQP